MSKYLYTEVEHFSDRSGLFLKATQYQYFNINPKEHLILFHLQLLYNVSSAHEIKSTGLSMVLTAHLNNDINGHAYSKHLGFIVQFQSKKLIPP